MTNAEMIQKAMSTARSSAFANKALVPRVIAQYHFVDHALWPHRRDCEILDYGCGKAQVHVKMLRDRGFNVVGHDFSAPNSEALSKKYDVIYASNVLNVQGDTKMLYDTLHEIKGLLNTHGVFVANYPQAPRYCPVTVSELLRDVRIIFRGPVEVFGAGGIPPTVLTMDGKDRTPCGSPSRSPVFFVRKFML
jgi:SAM-dependent methyltransferase